MKTIQIFLFFSLLILPQAALARNACYTPEQLRAEQLLRLHSELMVITVTCKQGSQGQDLPQAYGSFTKKNITVLHNAEQTLIAYYKKNEKDDALAHLDSLRTLLANEYGQKVADVSAPAFCTVYRDKVLQFNAQRPSDLENYVKQMETSEHSYVHPCQTKAAPTVK